MLQAFLSAGVATTNWFALPAWWRLPAISLFSLLAPFSAKTAPGACTRSEKPGQPLQRRSYSPAARGCVPDSLFYVFPAL
ncbi:hypothetical protein KCP78_01000 [Salmonella enterica subsp. enterica]|nr:hypothetical protein KCP78_01000 [Salmonella enterica subsp. enterica]